MEDIQHDKEVKVKRIDNSFLSSSSYLIYSDSRNSCFLVDCGDTDELLAWVNERKLTLSMVLLTHCHSDHIYGLNKVLKQYPDLVIVTNTFGKEGLYSDKINLSKYHDRSFIYEGNRFLLIEDKDNVDKLLEIGVGILPTPGHHPSCLSYKIGSFIFTGDSYIPGSKLVTNLPKGNKKTAQKSVEQIVNLVKKEKLQVMPGHYNID